MKPIIIIATMIIIFSGFSCMYAVGGENSSSEEKTLVSNIPPIATTVFSNTLKVWKNQSTGKWESEEVKDPTLLSTKANGNSSLTDDRSVVKSETPKKPEVRS